jgi:outer membrane lipoprotein carrier protein
MKKIVALGLSMFISLVFAQSPGELLHIKLNALRTMNANFSQTVKAKQRVISHSEGKMALSRPGRFRWETLSPMQQLVVADGKRLWIYDVDLEQVSVKKQEKSLGGTAGLFLSGYNESLAGDFDVRLKEKGSRLLFLLEAKSQKANFQRVKLMFEGTALRGIELYDQLGQVTDVKLNHVQVNPKLTAAMFQFKAPKGVDVVEQ